MIGPRNGSQRTNLGLNTPPLITPGKMRSPNGRHARRKTNRIQPSLFLRDGMEINSYQLTVSLYSLSKSFEMNVFLVSDRAIGIDERRGQPSFPSITDMIKNKKKALQVLIIKPPVIATTTNSI